MTPKIFYEEKLSSIKTTFLFLVLAMLFLALLFWRACSAAFDTLAIVILGFSVFFLFYSVNYRTLKIYITQEAVKLVFGIFAWTIPVENIQEFELDHLPLVLSMGGAGIHFFVAHGRYRVSFNFLEYPRVVITLKKKRGLVQDVSFSTQHPDAVLQSVRKVISISSAT
jgi:membrane protein YdbS with pleckstrin-like domain